MKEDEPPVRKEDLREALGEFGAGRVPEHISDDGLFIVRPDEVLPGVKIVRLSLSDTLDNKHEEWLENWQKNNDGKNPAWDGRRGS